MRYRNPLFISAIIFGIFVVIIIVAAIITNTYDAINNATLNLTVAPQTSTILVNGKAYKNGQHKIAPGEYHIEISKDGFTSEERDINVTEYGEASIYVALTQIDGDDWYGNHPEDSALIDSIASYNMVEVANKLAEEYPITSILPLNIEFYSDNYSSYTKYSISYRQVEDSIILVIKDYTGGNHENALKDLKVRGFKPEDYQIEYKDYNDTTNL